MHILLVADGRSPITLRWLEGLLALNHRVSLISSYPCPHPTGIEGFYVLPIAFSQFSGATKTTESIQKGHSRNLIKKFRGSFLEARYRLGPLTVRYYASRFRTLVKRIKPDLVHALRIPYEGMLASATPTGIPLVVSIWGNDLTLHAPRTRTMSKLTRQTLKRADGLHADTARDLRLAKEWAFNESKPTLVVPGNGGLDLAAVQSQWTTLPDELESLIPTNHTLIINPRGLRAYTKTATFFHSIPLILERKPDIAFLCPSMAGEAEAENLASAIGADHRVLLLPPLKQSQLWGLFKRCPVSISVTSHDGTPNTLLEAMACGSYPIVGNLESLREWITPGENGELVNPDSPSDLADAVVHALDNEQLRKNAGQINHTLVEERAGILVTRPRIEAFYRNVIRIW